MCVREESAHEGVWGSFAGGGADDAGAADNDSEGKGEGHGKDEGQGGASDMH